MATAGNNLSEYDSSTIPSAENISFGIVVSEWNEEITSNLLKGTVDTLLKHHADEELITIKHVPGTYELPVAAQMMLEHMDIDVVICIGSVIRGETAHFDYVCQAASLGIKDVSLKFNTPVIFCVLTDDNIEQSRARSGGEHGNKGDEAAIAAIKMATLQDDLIMNSVKEMKDLLDEIDEEDENMENGMF